MIIKYNFFRIEETVRNAMKSKKSKAYRLNAKAKKTLESEKVI